MGSSLLQTWQKREKRYKLAFVTQIHSINSIKYRSNKIQNKLQKALPDNLPNLTQSKAKEQITTTLLKSYNP